MSQDLFAAFGTPTADDVPGRIPWNTTYDQHKVLTEQERLFETSSNNETPAHKDIPPDNANEDDDFGEFEDASITLQSLETPLRNDRDTTDTKAPPAFPPKAPQATSTKPVDSRIGKHPFAGHMDFLFSGDDDEYDAGADDLADLSKNPEAAMAFSKHVISQQLAKGSSNTSQLWAGAAAESREASKQLKHAERPTQAVQNDRPAKNLNVLFDADDMTDESEEDDFGDFEGASDSHEATPVDENVRRPNVTSPVPNMDLLGLNDTIKSTAATSYHVSESVARPSSDPSLGLQTRGSRANAANSMLSEEESWDDFEAVEASTPTVQSGATAIGRTATFKPDMPTVTQTSRNDHSPPPTNVPPPVILLSAFPSIFSAARETLLDPLSKLDHADRQELLAHPATQQFLRRYLSHALVLSHIIAGRKLRWKRDQYLAQSMRIGPAAAGGKGGMKLAGIDKTEAAKEDREVLDTVRLWKSQIGKLRGAVTTATATSALNADSAVKLPPVPEIADQMPVRSLKATEGGFTAPHACTICGLKREERVVKVDVQVEDSFGEWWLDNMNVHVVCHDFWAEHKDKLRSR